MKKILSILGGVLASLVVIVVVRAATTTSRQVDVPAAEEISIDVNEIAARLAGGLRIPTISHEREDEFDTSAFEAFHAYLRASYPAVHRELALERINEWSLLYEWTGRDASLDPVLLLAHSDVVPVEAGTEKNWEYPPFSGAIEDGFVWGRGAMDDKGNLFLILEALELLLGRGYQPERTVLISFGHDEEVGGPRGAVAVAERLASRGTRLESVVDEGGAIADGLVPSVSVPVALVGIAEKGFVTVEMIVEVVGGHSSVPPRNTGIGIMAAAITRLEQNPMPGGIRGATAHFFDYLAPELSFPMRAVLANRWLFGGIVESAISQQPAIDAMLRTTTAATIFQGGVKSNVLPAKVVAAVNFRILPGDTWEDVLEHVRRTVDDDRVQVAVMGENPRNPSQVSPVDAESFRVLQRTIRSVFPDTPVVPYLVVGGTDSRSFGGLTENIYRFSPFMLRPGDLDRAHGTNERVEIQGLADGARFYVELIRNQSSSAGGE